MPAGSQALTLNANTTALRAPPSFKPFGEDGLTFRDVFDLVNPLQHIPLLGNLYRRITGDVIDPVIRVAGGALFGGPLGAGFAAASVAIGQILQSGGAEARTEPATPAGRGVSRGGWMIAATRVGFDETRPSTNVLAETSAAGPERVRRGGWMAQAAYAMADARARAAAAPGRRIDTTA